MFYAVCNEEVIKDMEECGNLLKQIKITHSYPHDWRTKKPVIFRATPQWFASIDAFRQNILDEIENVEWLLPSGKARIHNMIKDRGDWVISRQRNWGVPLPIFYAENGEAIITPENMRFESTSDFKISLERGGEIEFEWNGNTFGAFKYMKETPDSPEQFLIGPSDLTKKQYPGKYTDYYADTIDEILDYVIDGDRLRDIVTSLYVIWRSI